LAIAILQEFRMQQTFQWSIRKVPFGAQELGRERERERDKGKFPIGWTSWIYYRISMD